jgi:hypothetical protein
MLAVVDRSGDAKSDPMVTALTGEFRVLNYASPPQTPAVHLRVRPAFGDVGKARDVDDLRPVVYVSLAPRE